MEVLLIVTLVDGIFTVTLQVAVFPLVVFTVITALPFSTPVTTPEEDTFATFVFELLHFRLSVLSLGDIVPFRVYVFPLFKETEVLLKDTFVEGTFTVTLQEAVFPLPVFTVIVAEPLATPVTTPEVETFATLLFELLHCRLSFAPDGDIVAFSVYVFPLFTVTDVLDSVTFVAAVFTVTLQAAVFPLVVFAVIVAVPFATPVTTPLDDTFATFVFDDVHVTESVLLDGVKSGTRVYVFPV